MKWINTAGEQHGEICDWRRSSDIFVIQRFHVQHGTFGHGREAKNQLNQTCRIKLAAAAAAAGKKKRTPGQSNNKRATLIGRGGVSISQPEVGETNISEVGSRKKAELAVGVRKSTSRPNLTHYRLFPSPDTTWHRLLRGRSQEGGVLFCRRPIPAQPFPPSALWLAPPTVICHVDIFLNSLVVFISFRVSDPQKKERKWIISKEKTEIFAISDHFFFFVGFIVAFYPFPRYSTTEIQSLSVLTSFPRQIPTSWWQ